MTKEMFLIAQINSILLDLNTINTFTVTIAGKVYSSESLAWRCLFV